MHRNQIVFGRFCIDLDRQALLCDGRPAAVGRRAFEVLRVLALAGGRVVGKDEIMGRVWPGAAIGENNLYVQVSALRRALDPERNGRSPLVGVPGRGYRLVGFEPPLGEPAGPGPNTAPPPPDRPSIAVLPFGASAGELEPLADGITENIVTALGTWRWFSVLARSAGLAYKGRVRDAARVGRDTGVGYVLEGNVRGRGECLRVTAQLVDATNDRSIWAERFNFGAGDPFALEDAVAEAISARVEPAIAKIESHRARYKSPEQLTSWDHYLRGLWYLDLQSPEGARTALECFETALAFDERLTEAYVGIARAYHTEYGFGSAADRAATNARAEAIARKAIARDGENCYAHYVLALVAAHSGDPDTAVRAARRALDLNPTFAPGHFALAVGSLYLGRPEEALAAVDMALRLAPNHPNGFIWLALRASSLYLLRRCDEAIAAAEQSCSLRSFYTAVRVLAAAHAQLGRLDRARAAVAELLAQERSEKTIAEVVAPFQRAADRAYYAEGLRRAGFPEG